ncbi:unnamed protein product [Leptidea sinapis]|uniref:Gamma-interferon-inducible lysosomal thiol reductase n=1 Tax=Leptidea sinapis TaxID=189913 RepID=A0A5E4QX55_9NEOP|nr:unnamed protein product [Leptidea sinapis]
MTVSTFIYFAILFVATEYSNASIHSLGHKFQQADPAENEVTDTSEKVKFKTNDKVSLKVYYECLCPDCRQFDTTQFIRTVLKLGEYLDVKTYPYGNAKTTERDGKTEFQCQHGPEECYGNKLHACTLDIIKNQTTALVFNACMMDHSQTGSGSDDKAADRCGLVLSIDSRPIKKCANSDRGTELLKMYGVESKKANFNYVPYVLVNGVEKNGDNLMKEICEAFANPPPPCTVSKKQ